ncbi:MAG: hypothetical protein ACXAC7_14050 [Candidatus Hodarchaeales archaeon]|jgi:hypothetical protein
MEPPSLDRCLCGETISKTKPHCGKTPCITLILERLEYLFEDSISKAERITFINMIPIYANKTLIQKLPFEFNKLNEELQYKILNNQNTPIEILLTLIDVDYTKYLPLLQQNPQLKDIGKAIRRKKFTPVMINRLERMSSYFARFLYSSRKIPLWRTVLDNLVRSPFAPDLLLNYLDVLFRQKAIEYLQFYNNLQKNSRLTRLTYLITKSRDELQKQQERIYSKIFSENNVVAEEKDNIESDPEKITGYGLEKYANHWFPEIRVAAAQHPALFKNTLVKLYKYEKEWNNQFHSDLDIKFIDKLILDRSEAQLESPALLKLLSTVIKHPKVPVKLLINESQHPDPEIRRFIALSQSVPLKILKQYCKDKNPIVKTIAKTRINFHIANHNWLKENKNVEFPFFVPFPEQWNNWLEKQNETQFY